MDVRIDQLEQELAQKLGNPLKITVPGQYQVRVLLLDAKGRKKRSDASANNWSPASGRIEIRFEPIAQQEKTLSPASSRGTASNANPQPKGAPDGVSGTNSLRSPLEIEIRLLRALNR